MDSIAADERDGQRADLDPLAVFSAFIRVGYSDLVTVITTSVLTAVLSVFLLPLGGALLAQIDTLTTVVTAEGRTSAPKTERARLRYYVDSLRENFVRGIPYSVILAIVTVTTSAYLLIGLATGSTAFLLGAVAGLYAVVVVTVWVLRAMSGVVRAETPLPFREAMRAGWYSLLDELSFTALQAIVAAGLVLVTLWVRIAVPLLLSGLLVLLEVVAYEELHGDGASALVLGYRGELRD